MLLGQTNNISEVVATSLQDASNLQTIQAETSRSAVDLIRTLENLTDSTYAELGKINASAFEIQRRLSIQQNPVVSWVPFVVEIFSKFGQGGFYVNLRSMLPMQMQAMIYRPYSSWPRFDSSYQPSPVCG